MTGPGFPDNLPKPSEGLNQEQRSQWDKNTKHDYFPEINYPESFTLSEEFQNYVARPEVLATIKRSIIHSPEKIFSYYQSVLSPEVFSSVLVSPEVQEAVKKEVEETLNGYPTHKDRKRRENVKCILKYFPEITKDPDFLQKAQDKVIEQIKNLPAHSSYEKLETIFYFCEVFNSPKGFVSSSEILSIFPAILKSNSRYYGSGDLSLTPIETAKKFATIIGLSDEQTKKTVLDSIGSVLADYSSVRSSFYDLAPSVRIKEIQQVFDIDDQELELEDKISSAIEETLKKSGYKGLFFDDISALIHERNIKLNISDNWADLATRQIEDYLNLAEHPDTPFKELSRLMDFVNNMGLSVNMQTIKALLETQIRESLTENKHRFAIEPRIKFIKKYNIEIDGSGIFQAMLSQKKYGNKTLIDDQIIKSIEELGMKIIYENLDLRTQTAIKDLLKSRYASGEITKALEIGLKFNLPQEVSISIFREIVVSNIFHGTFTPGLFDPEMLKRVGVSGKAIFQEEEFIEAARAGLSESITDGEIDDALEWRNKLKAYLELDNETIKQIYEFVDSSGSYVPNNPNLLVKFIPLLGASEAEELLPLTLNKVREMIFAKLPTNEDLADYFLENLDKYFDKSWAKEGIISAIEQYSVAVKFKDTLTNDAPLWKEQPWVAQILNKAEVVIQKFQQSESDEGVGFGNEGFTETDPYEKHEYRFSGEKIQQALLVKDVLDGKADPKTLEGLDIFEGYKKGIMEIREKVEETFRWFLEEVSSNQAFPEEDKQALTPEGESPIHMSSLLDVLKSLVARFIIQSSQNDEDFSISRTTNKESLVMYTQQAVEKSLDLYKKIYEVDIPLYDKLYEEFDSYRETGRTPLEVYLGRDGIYAYVGRRSQDLARRRKLGPEGRKKLKEQGEVVEINPKYLVYPRYFRDNINYETKREFLEQERITPEADPLFYDTGYTGTIPEQIMKVMEFDQEDIDNRIRLLSAPVAKRRVKGIPENARAEIIEYIEHNAKTEETAVGLMKDPKTGKIRHIAQPTTPDEQLRYMLIKQAIARHYWLKEHLHHEQSGNVNFDSKDYIIRMRQEYLHLFPIAFSQNPQEYIAQHGELLKGSEGEGEYPDEEIRLLKLSDGTEVVAKRIELRKAKDAKKEFSILITAKKEGLATTEPVGFISAKEEKDPSYLLMKKLEGVSGRNIEKKLKESGKYSNEQIITFMKVVADKNRELAQLFREKLNIDKNWRIKDTIIDFDEGTLEVKSVIPIDWERVTAFDPNNPKKID